MHINASCAAHTRRSTLLPAPAAAELDEDDTPLVFMFVAPPPNEILCPICLDIMKDAVITPYGHSYCQKCVSKYASTAGLCPLTRKPLAEDQLTPNLLARTIVDEMEVFCPHGIKLGAWLVRRALKRGWSHGRHLCGLGFAGDNGWVEDPDGCTQKIKFGLRKPHLLTCLHANVECPAGGQRCGPIARMGEFLFDKPAAALLPDAPGEFAPARRARAALCHSPMSARRVASADVDFHLEEECQFSGRNKTEEVSENYVRANTTLQLFGVSFVVLAAFLVLLFQMGVLRDSIR